MNHFQSSSTKYADYSHASAVKHYHEDSQTNQNRPFKLIHKILATKEFKRYKIKPDEECFIFCKCPVLLNTHSWLAVAGTFTMKWWYGSTMNKNPILIEGETCLMTITQYNSNNSLIPEFKWSLFEKGNSNYLDELINIPTKAEERSMIQICFRTQDSNIKTGTILNSHQNSQLIHEPLCSQNLRIHSNYHKNPQSVRFLRPNLSIWKPIPPPLNRTIKQQILFNDYTLSQQLWR